MNHIAKTFRVSSSFAAALMVAACGGGSTNDTNAAAYLNWSNSANGVVVKDAAGNSFAVDSSTGNVISLASNAPVGGLTVPLGAAHVVFNGTVIGDVATVASTAGPIIVEFICSGPAPQYGGMTISTTPQGWSFTCASASGSSGGASGGSSGGASGSAALYGSLAVNASTLVAGVSFDYSSQTLADQAAISRCGGGACGVVINMVGPGACGAFAQSSNGAWAAAVRASAASAESSAISSCSSNGGTACAWTLYACN